MNAKSEQPRGKDQTAPMKQGVLSGFEEAYCEFMKSLQFVLQETQKLGWESYCKFERHLQESWGQPDSYRKVEEARQEHVRTLDVLHADARKRYEEAYFSYIRSAQAAWAGIDVPNLDIWALITIGRNMEFVGLMAARILGSFYIVGRGIPSQIAAT